MLIGKESVLPDNYADYLRNGRGLPCIRLNQEEKVLVGNVSEITDSNRRTNAMLPPVGSPRRDFFGNLQLGLIAGDSGNPMFIIVNGRPVLLTVWTSPESGTSIHVYKSDLNVMMSQLSATVGAPTNYQLQEIDLTGFTKLSRQP